MFVSYLSNHFNYCLQTKFRSYFFYCFLLKFYSFFLYLRFVTGSNCLYFIYLLMYYLLFNFRMGNFTINFVDFLCFKIYHYFLISILIMIYLIHCDFYSLLTHFFMFFFCSSFCAIV
jgi:hypothetical protein